MTGVVKNLILARGFGFIKTDDADVFFHLNDCLPAVSFDEGLVNQRVEFELGHNRAGKPCAKNVRLSV